MIELWKDIEGYEGIYQVSNTGKVKSCERLVRNNISTDSYRLCKERILKVFVNREDGYLIANLYKGKRIRTHFSVHRLVGFAFVKGYKKGLEINHKDGNKLNNNDWNLEWTDRSGNEKHAFRTGLLKIASTKLTKEQVEQIRTLNKESTITQRYLAKQFNISNMQISRIVNYKSWT